MASADLNQISHSNKDTKEEFSSFVVTNVVKARVRRIRLIASAVGTIVLKVHVEISGCRTVEIRQGILEPHHIDVLKQYVIAQSIDQMYAVHFCHHHARKS